MSKTSPTWFQTHKNLISSPPIAADPSDTAFSWCNKPPAENLIVNFVGLEFPGISPAANLIVNFVGLESFQSFL